MRKSRVLFYTASAVLLLSLTACGVTITAVHLPDEVQVNVGATAETAATYESKQEADAAAQQAAADRIDWTWAIADDTIATVDNSGVITGVKGGSTLVTVTSADGKFTASCPVTVSQPLQGIALSNIDLVINRTDNADINCTLTPADTTDTDLVWSVCNESIATVDEHGTVTAQGPGNCVVTAATPDGALKATYSLTVKAKQTVKAASNTSTTTPSYTAPSAPSVSTPTYVPEPAPAPAPAPAEPSQPSGGNSGGGIAGSYGGDYLDQNPEFGYSSGIDWTQDNSNGSLDGGCEGNCD